MTMPGAERLMDALRAERAAVYGYGVLGARLDGPTAPLATAAEQAHRGRRDALVDRLSEAGVSPPPAAPAYALPKQVTDRDSALRLAVTIEERTATAWRLALAEVSRELRQLALDALVDCAVRATRLRLAAGVRPATTPFPGRPGS